MALHIRKRRGGALLLLASMLLALTAGVSAADAEPAEDTLETRVAQFMEENYLNEQNFSTSITTSRSLRARLSRTR